MNSGFVMRPSDLDRLIPEDDPARSIWAYVQQLDLSEFEDEIRSVEGRAGRPAVDPAILLSVWMLAVVQAVGSAREVAYLCAHHDAYAWLCGGVEFEYRTLSDFRSRHGEKLMTLLTRGVTALSRAGLVQLELVGQDGMRVRANAGGSSFRTQKTLESQLETVQQHVQALEAELHDDPAACKQRQAQARLRIAKEREKKLTEAIATTAALEERNKRQSIKNGRRNRKPSDSDKAGVAGGGSTTAIEPRASTTDPEARVMRFSDGGYRPGYNIQFMSDIVSGVIVGVDVSNSGSDYDKLVPMLEQVKVRHGKCPERALVDSGYAALADIERAAEFGCAVYSPPVKSRKPQSSWTKWARSREPLALAQWRQRMESQEGKDLYRQRTRVELVNADARNRGLRAVTVRGIEKVKAVTLLFALVHNMMRSWALAPA